MSVQAAEAENVHEITQTFGTRVALSSGDSFWVRAEMIKVLHLLDRGRDDGRFVYVGSQLVNPAQVALLTHGSIPSTEAFETLED